VRIVANFLLQKSSYSFDFIAQDHNFVIRVLLCVINGLISELPVFDFTDFVLENNIQSLDFLSQ